ncbi:M56 family metallopeptidase [Luteimonas sp. R10]|uniref:M56 family metallopeptidase n=1 Tax=Luteimonas sp. R10 TaxID=3108176 RepID=UPI0030918CE2|nr:M56 family metallopeptidase [Luteimonas sp. R10]
MTDALAMLVPALALALLHFLWQGVLVGLLAWLALILLRNARPQARYAVACLALLACMLLPAWSLAQALTGADAAPAVRIALAAGDMDVAPPATQGDALRGLPAPPMDAQPWIVALWAAGVCLLSLRMACGLLWVRRLCRDAHAEAGSRWQACVDRLALRLGIGRRVALRLVGTGDGPVTAGWWRPVVLMPVAIASRMPADLVEALIAHELAHVRRHDYVVNLLQGAAEALLFHHPVVWWLSHRIRIERELVADDLAAAALGEPRRLALALSELDRHAGPRSPVPQPHYAPAARGGQLMSRIQRLVRPDRRPIGGTLLLPLIGLVVAGAAFYAQARMAPPPGASVQATPMPAIAANARPMPMAVAQALPAPTAKPGMQVMAAAGEDGRHRDSYALVRKDREGFSMSGDTGDIDDIRAARRHIDGDFLWFRRDGKAWVVRDADTVARARDAWAETDALDGQMQALEVRMKPHSDRMEVLGARLQALGEPDAFQSPEARAATAKMEALGTEMGALADRQAALALRMRDPAQADEQRWMEHEQEELARQQEALQQEMERHGATLAAVGERMEARHEPMEALGRQMEAASEPMEAIGEEMEALGARIEEQAQIADGKLRQLIDEAYRSGRAQPAPMQQ